MDLQKAVGGADEEPAEELSAEELVKFIARVKDGEEEGAEAETEKEGGAESDVEPKTADEKVSKKRGGLKEESDSSEKTGPQISDIKPRNKEK
jgi:hypothetical protein